jgi:hypothetical protein
MFMLKLTQHNLVMLQRIFFKILEPIILKDCCISHDRAENRQMMVWKTTIFSRRQPSISLLAQELLRSCACRGFSAHKNEDNKLTSDRKNKRDRAHGHKWMATKATHNLISMCHCASSHGGGEHEANMQNLSHDLLLDLLRSSMNITILFPNDQDTMIFKVKHIVFRVLKVISMEVDDDISVSHIRSSKIEGLENLKIFLYI